MKFEKTKAKVQVRDKFRKFVTEKYGNFGDEARLARLIGANQSDITSWWDSGAVPGWAILRILELRSDAKDFFLNRAQLVAEKEKSYEPPEQTELIREVESLNEDTRKIIIETLVTTLRAFKEIHSLGKRMNAKAIKNALTKAVKNRKIKIEGLEGAFAEDDPGREADK